MRLHADVPDPPMIIVGLQVIARPVMGAIVSLRVTVPVKPNFEVTVTVSDPELPGGITDSRIESMVNVAEPAIK